MNRGRLFVVLLMALVLVGLWKLGTSRKGGGDTTPPPRPPLGYVPKCPEHADSFEVVVRDAGDSTQFVTRWVKSVGLAGDRTKVVEVHDCQRLVAAGKDSTGGLEYGPLGMLFASDSLPELFTQLDRSGRPRRAAAAIFSWGYGEDPTLGDFPTLGIRAGWNCLYLEPSGASVVATMVPVKDESACVLPRTSNGTTLEVRTTGPSQGLTPDDIPAVARWDGDFAQGGKTQQIWVRCGDYACVVGPSGFKEGDALPSEVKTALVAAIGSNNRSARLVAFRGWYDQQLLAVPDGNGKLKVGTTVGTLIPHPAIGEIENTGRFSEWIPVAWAYLPVTDATYYEKLGLERGLNTIRMRQGEAPAGVAPCQTDPDGLHWWIEVRAPSGKVTSKCGDRFKHSLAPHQMPGTARWRWLDDDETTWVRCPQGCCTTK